MKFHDMLKDFSSGDKKIHPEIFSANKSLYLRNGARYDQSCY